MSMYLLYAGAALAALIAFLKIVAPKTKNTVDDKILDGAEKVETVVDSLKQ